MIDRLIAALRVPELGLDLDWRDLADVLWLATAQHSAETHGQPATTDKAAPSTQTQTAERVEAAGPSATGESPVGPTPPSPGAPRSWSQQPASDSPRTRVRFGARDEPGLGLDVEAPVRHALADRESIGRALRPFMRRRSSWRRREFDADATVSQFCDTGVLVPVMRPARERWFDVALVIDDGPTMVVWQETATALGDLLERHGAFRAVTRWHLDRDASGQPCLRTPSGHRQSPSVLDDATDPSIVIVLTDCVGDLWGGDSAWSLLRDWGRTLPVAILQPLPERAWLHTQMGEADIAVRSHRPGQANATLERSRPWWWDSDEPLTGVVPVVTLSADSVGPWADMVMGTPGVAVRALSGRADDQASPLSDTLVDDATPIPHLAELLRSGLSSTAYELAIHLSAVDLSLPIAHIVMDRVLPQAREEHLAELLVAGVLLQGDGTRLADATNTAVSLAFPGHVRETLQQSLTTTVALSVWRALVPHLEATGQQPRFSLVLDDAATVAIAGGDLPAQASEPAATEMLRIAAQVAARLGFEQQATLPRTPVPTPAPDMEAREVAEDTGQEHEGGRLFALLVGIDAYKGPVPPLAGCVNDVTAFGSLLQRRVAPDDLSMLTITNERATRDTVMTQFTAHLGQAGPQDVALFYYSGHGAHQDAPEELWDVEPSHQNETLVLVDSREPGGWDLADREFAVLVSQVSASGCHLLVVLDCCHSGDATRSIDEVVRQAARDPRPRPVESFLAGTVEQRAADFPAASATTTTRTRDFETVRPGRWMSPSGRHVLLEACRPSESAKEIRTLGQFRGAMSVALEKVLLQSEGMPSYRELLVLVTSEIDTLVRGQHPQLETVDSSELDRPFLGGAIPDTRRPLTLSRRAAGWTVDFGAVHGVPEPIAAGDNTPTTEFAIYPLSTTGQREPLATALVSQVLPDRSVVTVTPELDPSSMYRAVVTFIPLKPVSVVVTGDPARRASLRRAADNADASIIDLVEAFAPGPAGGAGMEDLHVEATSGGFVITRPGLVRPHVAMVAGEDREGRTIDALEHVARWLRLSRVANPTSQLPPDAIHVSVVTAEGRAQNGGTVEITYVGETPPRFTVSLENTTKEPLWAALLDLTDSYGIYTDAFAAGCVALGPGEKTRLELGGEVPDVLWREGGTRSTDQLIVIASTVEFDPRSLQQGDLNVNGPPGSAGVSDQRRKVRTRPPSFSTSTLERVLGSVASQDAAPSTNQAIADWRTASVFVTTIRPRA